MAQRRRALLPKIVIVVGLLVLVTGAIAGARLATSSAKGDPFSRPAHELRQDDFWRIMEMVLKEGSVTPDQVDALVEELTPEQKAEFEGVMAEYLVEFKARLEGEKTSNP